MAGDKAGAAGIKLGEDEIGEIYGASRTLVRTAHLAEILASEAGQPFVSVVHLPYPARRARSSAM